MKHPPTYTAILMLTALLFSTCGQEDRGIQPVENETGLIDVKLIFNSPKPAKIQAITDIWITAWSATAQPGTRAVGFTQLQKIDGRGIGLLKLPTYDSYQIRAVAKRDSTVVFLGIASDVEVRADMVSSVSIPMSLAEISGFEVTSYEPGTATLSWKTVGSSPHYQLRLLKSDGQSTLLYHGPDNQVSLPINQLNGESIRASVINQFFPLGNGIEHVYEDIPKDPTVGITDVSIASQSEETTPSSTVNITTTIEDSPALVDVFISAGDTPTSLISVTGAISETPSSNVSVVGQIDETPISTATVNINGAIGGTSPCDQDQTSSSYIFWTDKEANKIQRANADGGNITEVISGLSTPIDIALDQANEKLYFTLAAGIIEMANLDGSQVQTIVNGLAGHTFIALDIPNNQIYWSIESSPGLIQRADLYGTGIQTLISGDLGKVKYAKFISLDPINNKLFYRSNTPGNTDYLIKALHLDGTGNIESVISGQFNNGVEGIAVDTNGRKIYWAGRDSDTIYRSNLDGSGSESLITGLSDPMGIALDLVSQKIYWTDEGSKDIQRANLDGTGKETIISGLSSPNAIQVLTCD